MAMREAREFEIRPREDPLPIFGGREQLYDAIRQRELVAHIARELIDAGKHPYDAFYDLDVDFEQLSQHDMHELTMCLNSGHMGFSSIPQFGVRANRWTEYGQDVTGHSDRSAAFARVRANNRRARKRGQESSLTGVEWLNILNAFGGACAYCGNGVDKPHMEHLVPISEGGGTERNNVAPACASCNTKKRCLTASEWAGFGKHAEIVDILREANP